MKGGDQVICHGNRDCNLNGKHCVQCMINDQEYQNLVTHAPTKLAEAVIRLAAEDHFLPDEMMQVWRISYDPEEGWMDLCDLRLDGEDTKLSEESRMAVNEYIEKERTPLVRSVYGVPNVREMPLFVIREDRIRGLRMKDLRIIIYQTAKNAGFSRKWFTTHMVRHFLFAAKGYVYWIRRWIYLKRHPYVWMP